MNINILRYSLFGIAGGQEGMVMPVFPKVILRNNRPLLTSTALFNQSGE